MWHLWPGEIAECLRTCAACRKDLCSDLVPTASSSYESATPAPRDMRTVFFWSHGSCTHMYMPAQTHSSIRNYKEKERWDSREKQYFIFIATPLDTRWWSCPLSHDVPFVLEFLRVQTWWWLSQEPSFSSDCACFCSNLSQSEYYSNVGLLCVCCGMCFVSICHRVN